MRRSSLSKEWMYASQGFMIKSFNKGWPKSLSRVVPVSDCEDVVKRMIERFNLNVSLDMKRAIYVVDDQYVVSKIEKPMTIQGDIGFIIKVGLFSGLREEEIIYSHSKEICPDNAGHKCDKLHVINKPNGMSIITLNWFRGNKQCYFFIMPTNIWKQFRSLSRFTRKEEITALTT